MCKPSDPRRLHLADQSNASERHLIIMPTFVDVPEIKLIRTDTTLDLSQKAEKVCFGQGSRLCQAPRPEERGLCVRAWGRRRRTKKNTYFTKERSLGVCYIFFVFAFVLV